MQAFLLRAETIVPKLVATRPPGSDPELTLEDEVSGVRLVPTSDDEPCPLLAGKYRLEGVIAEGGVGVVYRAWHMELERHVAIKMLRPKYGHNVDAIARLHREAQVMAQLHGNHSARVMDVGATEDGTAFIVLELLEGTDLRQLLRKQGPLSVPDMIDFMWQTARGIAEVHAEGLIHCDLKPDNLFLATQIGEAAVIKLIDFGISKSSVKSSTEASPPKGCVGSPQYMSPEQFKLESGVDIRTDVWSLGVTFYELGTGHMPFKGNSLVSICASITYDEPISPRQLRADLPEALERVLLRCLAKDRESRYPSMLALMDDLLLVDAGAIAASSYSSSIRPVHNHLAITGPVELDIAVDWSPEPRVRRPRRALLTMGVVAVISAGAYFAAVNQAMAVPGAAYFASPAAHSSSLSARSATPQPRSTPKPNPATVATLQPATVQPATVQFAELAEVREQERPPTPAPASRASWHVSQSGRDSSGIRRVTGLPQSKPTSMGTSDQALEERYGLSDQSE